MANEKFSEWLQNELNRRSWSQAELARRANVTRAAINAVLTGSRGIGSDLCEAIAHAFGYPPETVFRAAGILPAVSERSEQVERILNYLEKIPQANMDAIEIQLAALANHVKPPKTGKTGPLGGGHQ